MIHVFMPNIIRDMKNISNSASSHVVASEELLYYGVISIKGQHEVWETYVRDKDK